jgi:hypothetical protein
MGYLDLGLKLAEIVVYGICLGSLGVMKVFPWRKKILEERLKEGK